MLDLNPYKYDSAEYHEYELKVAKRNLELVTEAATARIKNATEETACAVATEMSEAIIYATNEVRIAESSVKRAKEKESKTNE